MSALRIIFPICIIIFLLANSCAPTESDERYCRHLLLTADEEYDNGNLLKATMILTEAREVARENRQDTLYHKILTRLARNFSQMGDDAEALQIMKADLNHVKSHLDSATVRGAMNNLGILLTNTGQTDSAEKVFSQLYIFAKEASDSLNAGSAASNLAHISRLKGLPGRSADYVEAAISFINPQDKENYLRAASGKAYLLIDAKQWHKAAAWLDSILPEDSSGISANLWTELVSLRIKVALKYGDVENAKQLIANIPNSNHSFDIVRYQFMRDLNETLGNIEIALAYADSVNVMQQAFYEERTGMIHDRSQVRFEYETARHDLINSEKNIRYLVVTIISIVIAVIACSSAIAMKIRRDRIRHQMTEKQRIIARLELENARSRNSSLEENLEKTNRKLASNILSLSRRSSLIRETMEYISSIPGRHGQRQWLNRLKAEIISDSETEDAMQYFRQINSRFLSELHRRHPSLSANDVRFLSYVYIQLSLKETAQLLNISEEAARKRKQRIKGKLGLDSSCSLYSYLVGL